MTVGIHQQISPIKFCFLIKPSSMGQFEDAVKLSYSMWGGMLSPILPLYERMPASHRKQYMVHCDTRQYYLNTIANYDPDIVLFGEGLKEGYIKEIAGDRACIAMADFTNKLLVEEQEYGISTYQVLLDVIEHEFKFKRTDSSKLFFPTVGGNTFFKVFFGELVEGLHASISTKLQDHDYFEAPILTWNNLSNYYPHQNCSFGDVNLHHIRTFPEKYWYRGSAVYFLRENNLIDLVNFWNLRALGWNLIPIPLGEFDNRYFHDLLNRYVGRLFAKDRTQYVHCSILISHAANAEEKFAINELMAGVNSRLGDNRGLVYQNWFPRYWEERLVLEADKTICERSVVNASYKQIEVDGDRITFESIKLPFKAERGGYSEMTHKVNLEFTYFDEFGNYAGVVAGINTSDWRRMTHSFGAWRASDSGLIHYLRSNELEIRFTIPKATEFFNLYFSKKNLPLKVTPNGKLAYEVLKNVGGFDGFGFIRNKASLDILSFFEGGKTVKRKTLEVEIKKAFQSQNSIGAQAFFIEQLLEKKIIEFGTELQCSVCNQRSFYLLKALDDEISCLVCRNRFLVNRGDPKNIIWAYRGIGPFSKNNKVGGLMTVFLALNMFSSEFTRVGGDLTTLIGFELSNKDGGKLEVDLAVMLQDNSRDGFAPDLALCECKTFQSLKEKDFERMIELGEKLPNSILVFATLRDGFTESEKLGLRRVVNHFRVGGGQRPINSILLLTANELIPSEALDHFRKFKNSASTYVRHNDWLGHLCELTIKEYLGLQTWGEIKSEEWAKLMEERNTLPKTVR